MASDLPLTIARLTWMSLIKELRKRGRGRREAGAFLMASKNPSARAVEDFICYDDLDPRALSHGIVEFHRTGFSTLWDICKQRGMRVIADVHTHPTHDVRQSYVDQAHPMIPVHGHVALILPRFGDTSRWSLAPIGIHRFAGGGQWESFAADDEAAPIRLTWW